MKAILIVLYAVFLISFNSFGQSCNCSQEFNYVKDKIENNYAGFRDKVNDQTEAAYHKHSISAFEQSKLITTPAQCIYLINKWLTFFKDGHIQVGRNRISKEREEVYLKARIQRTEHIYLSEEELGSLKNTKGIAGIYWDKDSVFKIAVLRKPTAYREYVGVIISSKTGKKLPGEVTLELTQDKKMLRGIYYDKYYIPENVSLQISKDALGTFKREGSKQPSGNNLITDAAVAGKLLSKKTLYIRISSFNQRYAGSIDSLFKVNSAKLHTMPNLILDLRNNGGGADFSYRPVIPYLYTNTMRLTGADVLSTRDNIAGWAAVGKTDGIPPDQQKFITEVIEKMEQNKGKLVSFSADQNIHSDSIASYPKKVIILIDGNCGSTTEEFLLMAKQSSKVTLLGEHTAGVLDYANVRGADFNCLPYMLYWATSRSRRIDQKLAIDNIGIVPDKILKPAQNWIEEAKHFAEQ